VLREWRLLAGLGITGLAAFHTLTNLAMHTTTALNAILMLSLVPATILLGGALSGCQPTGACAMGGHGRVAARRRDPDHPRQPRRAARPRPVRGDLWMIVGVLLWTVVFAAAAAPSRPTCRPTWR
jgi:drug/metabolite transporter (DMT)-like permease